MGLSDIWLAHMGVGTVQAALEEAIASIDGRRAIMGANMVNMPNVQANLGAVTAAVTTARFAVEGAAADVDARIAAGRIPTEADFQRQGAVSATALTLCQDAMMTLLRTLGGNGLREGGTFERRWRDVAAMPIHINTHPDRVHLRLGQFLLGVEGQRF
ncbi:MAG: acyl-CoA dehydrogenase family protein [Acidimicrobiales bacterium]